MQTRVTGALLAGKGSKNPIFSAQYFVEVPQRLDQKSYKLNTKIHKIPETSHFIRKNLTTSKGLYGVSPRRCRLPSELSRALKKGAGKFFLPPGGGGGGGE